MFGTINLSAGGRNASEGLYKGNTAIREKKGIWERVRGDIGACSEKYWGED